VSFGQESRLAGIDGRVHGVSGREVRAGRAGHVGTMSDAVHRIGDRVLQQQVTHTLVYHTQSIQQVANACERTLEGLVSVMRVIQMCHSGGTWLPSHRVPEASTT
jgi:hypothetical protein